MNYADMVGTNGCLWLSSFQRYHYLHVSSKNEPGKEVSLLLGRIYYTFSYILMNVRYFEVIHKTNHKKQEFISGDNKDNVIKVFRVIERVRQ